MASQPTQPSSIVKDEHYDLISILYHSLQAADTCHQYCDDAKSAGDKELTLFFKQVCDDNIRIAEQAKRLMAKRLETATAGR